MKIKKILNSNEPLNTIKALQYTSAILYNWIILRGAIFCKILGLSLHNFYLVFLLTILIDLNIVDIQTFNTVHRINLFTISPTLYTMVNTVFM